MGTPKVNANFSSSNYFDFSGSAESLNMLGVNLKTGPVNFSVGVGSNTTYKLTSDNQDVDNKFALEAKLKYNINNNLNTQARFRKIGDSEQYRITFGGSYNFDKKNSIYSSVHLTTKHSNDSWKTNTGAWVGYTHNFNNCSLSAELQQNIPFNRKIDISDTMFNVMLNIPF